MPLDESRNERMPTRTSPRLCVLERKALTRQGSKSVVETAKPCLISPKKNGANVRYANCASSPLKRACKRERLKINEQCKKDQISTPYLQCILADEALLNLFSFLTAKDICSLACVCQRFRKISMDSTLWEQLYKRIFGLEYILLKTDRGLYERIPRDVLTKDSWHEAFIGLYASHHVVFSKLQRRCEHLKYHNSLKEAIKSAPENGIIIMHPGIYKEELIIKKAVTIIGAGSEEKPEVTLEGSIATVLKFLSGSSTSYFRNINIKYVGVDGTSCPSCIEIGPDCTPTIHCCNVVSKANDEDPSLRIESFAIRGVSTNYALIYCPTVLDVTSWPCSNTVLDDVGPMCSPHLNKTEESASGSLRITSLIDDHVAQLPVRENQSTRQAGSTIYVHGQNARPLVINCSITDSENVGIFVNNKAQGIYENNEISNNKLAGVWVKNGANPIMRNNKVHHGRDVGFFVFENGQGYYDRNDIFSNRIAGFEVRNGGNPTVVRCRIHHGITGGIYVHDEGRGQFLDNKIYANTFAGIWITSRSNPTIRGNEISSGQQGGVYVFGDGRGVIENNNIHSNALAGIQIRSQSNPIVRHNKIHHGLHGGIYVHEGGLGLIENNEVYWNSLAGIWITTGSSPIIRNNRIHSGKQVGVYFYDNGSGLLEDNEIFNHKYSGIQIRTSSNPVVRRNKIWGGQNGGVLVYNQGRGLLEENEIFDNAMAGVWIKTESDPILRRNKIHDGREGGICIFNGGKGLLENNDIFRNTLTGVLISSSSFPVLRGNRIFEGGTTGIEVTNGAGGILESNEVFNNKFSGICLATGVKPQLSNNLVYDNKEVIKSTVESGCCLFTVSGNICYPMHDFYRCNTCGRLESFAICINCIKRCHQGHDVEFVRRDRFFCDCGAGTTGTPCQLLNKNDVTQKEHQRSRNTCGESRVNPRCACDVTNGVWPNLGNSQKTAT